MKGKTVVSLLLAALFALVFVLAVAGCSSVSPTADGSYRESRLATATTLEEVWGVFASAPRGSEVQKAAMEKMLSLATTFTEVLEVYWAVPKGEVEKAAMEKMLSLATTFTEVREVYWAVPKGSGVEKAALEKLDAILKPRLAAATTLEEVWGAYRYAPYGRDRSLRLRRKKRRRRSLRR